MKISMLFFTLLILVLLSSCKKEDTTNSTDITEFTWGLQSVTVNGEKSKTPSKDGSGSAISNDNPYQLIFKSDSVFTLNVSVNDGQGNYYIPSKGTIWFEGLGLTKKCCENDFDGEISDALKSVISYQVINESLILLGEDYELVLKK